MTRQKLLAAVNARMAATDVGLGMLGQGQAGAGRGRQGQAGAGRGRQGQAGSS